jgi:hypothetical protein
VIKEDILNKMQAVGLVLVLALAAIAIRVAMQTGVQSPIWISGTIEVDQKFKDQLGEYSTLYIILYDNQSQMPMPYGAMKETISAQDFGDDLKYNFLITKERLQIMGGMAADNGDTPPVSLRIKARLDRDGSAGPDQPGDLVGSLPSVDFGSQHVDIQIADQIQ